MKWLILLLLTFSFLVSTLAQSDFSSYKNIAGDTSIYLKDYVLLDTTRQDTLTENFNAGTYRIILDQRINTHDVEIDILNKHNQALAINKYERYIDFTNLSASTLRFIVYPKNQSPEKITGKVFWIYSKNISKELPPFQIADIDSNMYNQESLRGKVVVLNFWGIQCAPCKKEIPQLNNLAEEYAHTNDIIFLAVSDDTNKQLREYLQHTKFDYRLVSDKSGLFSEMLDYKGIMWPSHAILDKEGKVVFQYLGSHPHIEDMLAKAIEKHL